MRAFACALAASIFLAGAAGATPRRVASLNLCTDELLLTLGHPAQIASVTHLSQAAAETPFWDMARRYRRNDGSLLSVAPVKPDLVLTMGGGARDRIDIADRLGFRTMDLPYPLSLQDMKASIAKVAIALGRRGAGRDVLARIIKLERTAAGRKQDAIWLGGGGRSIGATGLAADWMALAGLKQRSLQGDRVSLEQLLTNPPSILLRSSYRANQYSGEQKWLSHPLARTPTRSRSVTTDGRLWTCMGPTIVSEIVRLRAELSR